jgi:hypothetical protein
MLSGGYGGCEFRCHGLGKLHRSAFVPRVNRDLTAGVLPGQICPPELNKAALQVRVVDPCLA